MAMIDYAPPVDQLERLGDLREIESNSQPKTPDEWLDYRALGLGTEQVSELIRMMVDPRWDLLDSDRPEVYAPIHAWRALGQLRAEQAIDPILDILGDQQDDWDDWATEELPAVLGLIGPAAIPGVWSRLEAAVKLGKHEGIYHVRSLTEIARHHPESRDECLALLTRLLEGAEHNDLALNGFVILDLIELKANGSAGVIERAFAGEWVDDSITGTWHEVWHRFDLEGDPPPQTERKHFLWPRSFDDLPLFSENLPLARDLADQVRTWQPAYQRSPIERKDRNKARQKLEKKAKGKKGKKR